jgi:hypothetical protein
LKRIQFLLDLSWVADCRKCETPANGEHQLLELLVSIRRQLRLEADQQIIRRDCGRDLHHVTIREKRSVARLRSLYKLHALQGRPATNGKEC